MQLITAVTIGRVWLTVLFLFRMLVLGTAAESAWDDEQADFVCNTLQPGCTAVCYDNAFPISHFRYFVLQVIFVSTPTIFFFGYVAVRAGKERRKEDEKQAEEGDSSEAPKLKGRLLGAYAFSIILKVLLEVGFIVGLWFLYDGFFIAPKFECSKNPCPHMVDCFVSRPTEKTIFTIYTQVIAVISLKLNCICFLFQCRFSPGTGCSGLFTLTMEPLWALLHCFEPAPLCLLTLFHPCPIKGFVNDEESGQNACCVAGVN
uniref:Gap junction protein n=1 Tax=Amphilophus citrinellus TaxID=61819 RepID=A0A3Q0R580_AMPCI